MMSADGLEAFAAPVTCAGPDDVADAEDCTVLLAPLDAAPPFADAELTAEDEPALVDVELTTEEVAELTTREVDELTTEEVDEPCVVAEDPDVAAGVDVELRTTGAVLLFAEAWLVTATLREGVGPVELATLSVAGTGRTVAVLVLEAGATMDCADLGAQKSMNCANCGLT